ncbi:hypothetical protein DENSPDRAFT_840995 [Dentipellis sp. KUC8613]|nr:hypothetical protein DENSPDRAFT_840995 [Dentipellis sp. KUC8613]
MAAWFPPARLTLALLRIENLARCSVHTARASWVEADAPNMPLAGQILQQATRTLSAASARLSFTFLTGSRYGS